MLPKRHAQDVVTVSTKRPKGTPFSTHSQPIPIESPLSSPRPLPRKALVEASQASNFEAQLRKLQPEEAINPPTEGSKEATIATDKPNDIAFDENIEDNFDGLDWDGIHRFKIVYWFVNGYQSGCGFSCLITVLLGHL
jgi:hypothetical protein